MVNIISRIIAILITLVLACILYPIAALFWILGIIGEFVGNISKKMFGFTNHVIKHLWSDISDKSNE